MEQQTYSDSALRDKARAFLPGGSFGNTGADLVIVEGTGGRVRDAAGNEYVDFLLGSGPMLIGHRHPEVIEAVRSQLERGTTFFANSAPGILLAEAICEAMPCAEKVRFTSSGSEATLYAMRAMRALRKRSKILKFEGGYHGMNDYALMSLAPAETQQRHRADSGLARNPGRRQGRGAGRAVQRSGRSHLDHRGAPRLARRRHRRSVPAGDSTTTRISRGASRPHRASWPSARVRRGRYRLPVRLWRSAGVLRSGARSVHGRQGRRRRIPPRGPGRPRGDHVAVRPRIRRR